MQFNVIFTRVKPAAPGKVTLNETAPPDNGAGVPTAPNTSMDNLLSVAFRNEEGWPSQRIAVVCKYTGAGDPSNQLNATGFIWEDQTKCWYKVNATVVVLKPTVINGNTITYGTVLYFDTVGLLGDSKRPAGSLDFLLIVADAGAAPNGTYDFAIAPDTTTTP